MGRGVPVVLRGPVAVAGGAFKDQAGGHARVTVACRQEQGLRHVAACGVLRAWARESRAAARQCHRLQHEARPVPVHQAAVTRAWPPAWSLRAPPATAAGPRGRWATPGPMAPQSLSPSIGCTGDSSISRCRTLLRSCLMQHQIHIWGRRSREYSQHKGGRDGDPPAPHSACPRARLRGSPAAGRGPQWQPGARHCASGPRGARRTASRPPVRAA